MTESFTCTVAHNQVSRESMTVLGYGNSVGKMGGGGGKEEKQAVKDCDHVL